MRFAAWAAIACLVTGCSAPGLPVPSGIVQAKARLAVGGYRLAGVVAPYTAADVAEVRLTLFRQEAGGWAPTGAARTVAAAALAHPVALGGLRIGTAYRVRADAYSVAGVLISDPAGSETELRTPAVAATGGIDAIDDAALDMGPLKLKLVDRTYAGTAAWTLGLGKGIAAKVATVTVTLSAGDVALVQRSYPVSALAAGQTTLMGNLKAGTGYKLQADGFDAQGRLQSNPRNSTVAFTTPAATGAAIDDVVSAVPFVLPCK